MDPKHGAAAVIFSVPGQDGQLVRRVAEATLNRPVLMVAYCREKGIDARVMNVLHLT
jgi:hypothetical protein